MKKTYRERGRERRLRRLRRGKKSRGLRFL